MFVNIISKLKWFYPGMKIKRWFLFLPIGLICVIIGTVFLVNVRFESLLRYMGRIVVDTYGFDITNRQVITCIGAFFLFLGILIIGYVLKQVLHSIVYTISGNKTNIADQVYKKRFLTQGPRIVVIGGGTGLSTMLRGLKEYTSNITAVVTVSDDGGSSGRLKTEMGILPPGDIRNCLVALADTEDIMEDLLQYRFENINNGMSGHSFGNIMLGALSDITGDFESAVGKLADILAIRGKVYPCSLSPIELVATFEDGTVIEGETKIASYGKPIKKLELNNKEAVPSQEAVDAIKSADLIVLGPGSLYTSVIPNLLIKEIKNAVIKSKAKKVYVCNVMTQPGETDNFTAFDHFNIILSYLDNTKIDYCVVNNVKPAEEILNFYKDNNQEYVEYNPGSFKGVDTKVVTGDLMQEEDSIRHDYKKLAKQIVRLVWSDKHRN